MYFIKSRAKTTFLKYKMFGLSRASSSKEVFFFLLPKNMSSNNNTKLKGLSLYRENLEHKKCVTPKINKVNPACRKKKNVGQGEQ